MQQPEIENSAYLGGGPAGRSGALGSHDTDTLAMTHIVHADQIQRIRQGIYGLPQIGVYGHELKLHGQEKGGQIRGEWTPKAGFPADIRC